MRVTAGPTTLAAITLAAAALVGLVGCASGASALPAGPPRVIVSDAWVRPTSGTDASAAYFRIQNGSDADDTLTGVSTPVAKAEMHETTAGDSGMMGMQPITSVQVAKGATVEFKPGGYHVMLLEPTAPFEVGQTITLTLTFQKAGPIEVTAQVRSQP